MIRNDLDWLATSQRSQLPVQARLPVRLGAKQLWHYRLGIAVQLMPCAGHEFFHPWISVGVE